MANKSTQKVLVVDDEEPILELLKLRRAKTLPRLHRQSRPSPAGFQVARIAMHV